MAGCRNISSHVNAHGAPTRAMWTDLVFNLILLAIASADAAGYFFILAVSNCGYIIFNFLNLNAGWIHRMDNGHIERPWRAPTWLLGVDAIFAFVNAVFMGAGAKVWNSDRAVGRPYLRRADHPGLLLPPLHPGRRQVPRSACSRTSA